MEDTNFKMWISLSLVMLIFLTSSESAIGDACSHRTTCGVYSSDLYECENEHCLCSKNGFLSYDEITVHEQCSRPIFNYQSCFDLDDSCPANSYCGEGSMCRCSEGYVKVGRECRKAIQQEILQPCHATNNEMFICNISEHSVCRSGKCVCFDKYFPNTTIGQCEHQSSYLKLHGLSVYRVKPGVYCKSEKDCISGLKCKNFTCSCPADCTYESSKEVCDCGEDPKGGTVGPLIVGCVLAIFIIIFWYKRIKATIERLQKEKSYQTQSFSSVPHESHTKNSYNLTHTPSPFPAISQNTNAHAVPPSGGTAPPKAEPNSINLSEIAPYPINQTGGTPGFINQAGATPYPNDFSQPPPYPLTSTAASLPSSVNLPPVSGLYPSGSYSPPFPSNPSGPLNILNTNDTPYPLNPHVTPQIPYYETGNNTAPTAYNPAYKE